MIVEIKVPSVGESVTEAILGQWFKNNGDMVKKGDPLFVIETDKVTLEVESEVNGVLKISVTEGETVAIGAVVGTIDTDSVSDVTADPQGLKAAGETVPVKPVITPLPEPSPTPPVVPAPLTKAPADVILSPAVRRLVIEKGVDVTLISGTGPGGRVTKGDLLLYLEQAADRKPDQLSTVSESRVIETAPVSKMTAELTSRKPMTPIRQRIASRLLEAKQNTAMLTTFNDIDMSRVIAMRTQYKESFLKKHGVSLGFMSFFIKACVEALKEFPEINAFVDGKEFVYHHYYHIGVAIGTGRGLVVPVLRHCENLSMASMEQAIVDYVVKINENRLDLTDLEGGTFTITNGGVFGSLLSTPILNTPQSAILGMHRIEKRPVVVDDQIVVRPMMYVALSYDHRIVDGREAVSFLKRIKEFVENSERIIMEI